MRIDAFSAGLSRWIDQVNREIRISGLLLIKDAPFTTVTILTLALAMVRTQANDPRAFLAALIALASPVSQRA